MVTKLGLVPAGPPRSRRALRPDLRPKRLAILGATGSIGRSCAQVIAFAPGRFAVASVAGVRDGAALARCAIELNAEFAAVADPAGYGDLKAGLAGTGVEAAAGPEAVREAALREADLVVSAIVGAAGLEPTLAALERGIPVALANKETLVAGGDIVAGVRARSGAALIPVDSEHSAVFQLLAGKDQTLLVGRDAFLVLDLALDVVDGVRALDLKGDGLASDCEKFTLV